MRIRIQLNWRNRACRSATVAITVMSAAATITVVAETLRVPQPPLPPGAETVAMPPLPPSPVDNFRYWLSIPAEKRAPFLAMLPEADRKALSDKLAFYDALPADVRELRLSETQLHWQLLSLMRLPAAERKARIAQLPVEDRQVVQQRLHQWDMLPADKQKTFLENEQVVGVYLELQETAPQDRAKIVANLPRDIPQRLQKWNSLPATQRQEMSDRFTQLFQSEESAREKIIAGLPEDVRVPVQQLTEQLKQLPPEQRQKCTVALNKFLKMSPDDQRQFLQNATRWQNMSEKEHNAWRQVVNKVPQLPPLPPGLEAPMPPPLFAGTNSVVPANAP